MIKIFLPGDQGLGQNTDVWDQNWAAGDLERAVRSAADDHLSPYFQRYFPREGLILEGGCGLGQYVVHYSRQGYNIVGVDFAETTVRRLKQIDPDLPVEVGDVTRLPFQDDSVACYYSGGVIEHFEEGPEAPLREAWRVLAPGGRLLITVPYVNAIRRVRHRRGRVVEAQGSLQRWTDGFGVDAPPPGFRFSEYQMTRREFRRALERNGFQIDLLRPVDLLWGELGQRLLRNRRGRGTAAGHGHGHAQASSAGSTPGAGRARRLARDLLVRENPRHPLFPAVRALNGLSGHMILAVCTPAGKKMGGGAAGAA